MDDEKLIELVRKYEFLYNLKHPKYMDSSRKDAAWRDIAEHVKQSAAACKERWQNLRDAYRRALGKKRGKAKLGAKNIKPWKYENEMAFVVPFFVKRKPESVEVKSDGEESDNFVDDQYQPIESFFMKKKTQKSRVIKMEHEDSDNSADDNYHTVDQTVTEISNPDVTADPIAHNSNNNDHSENSEMEKSRGTKRKIDEPENTTSATLIARLLSEHYRHAIPREHKELDAFFMTISDTVKKFSPYMQALAKNKIFTLVSEMELRQLAPNSTSTH